MREFNLEKELEDASQASYPEQTITKLRLIEVAMSSGKSTQLPCKKAGISEQSYYRWRKQYGGLQHDQARRFKELDRENARLKKIGGRTVTGEGHAQGSCGAKLVSPERRRRAVCMLHERYAVSERSACRVRGQPRAVQRDVPTVHADEDALTQAIVALAAEYGRYGYRRITTPLQSVGWQVG